VSGAELQAIRKALGLTLREMAHALGYADSAVRRVRRWEREGCSETVGRKVRELAAGQSPADASSSGAR